MFSRFIKRNDCYQPALFWFVVFALCWTIVLLYAGAYTTSIHAGMIFLDWPLSNSSFMPDGWWENQHMRAEHSHRLLAATLGYLAIIIAAWAFLRIENQRVRQLAYSLLALVVAQGLLGGLRVLYDKLNTDAETNVAGYTFRILHALGAELTLCALTALALVLSRRWLNRHCGLENPVPARIRNWGLAAVATLIIQITLGALMRHAGAGLAIPTFPLTPDGGFLPSMWTTPITLHWLHRLGAVFVTIALLGFLGMLYGRASTRRALKGWIIGVTALLAVQIFLGAATIWTHKNPVMASTHMLVGALLLASVWTLTLQTFRLPNSDQELTNRRLNSSNNQHDATKAASTSFSR